MLGHAEPARVQPGRSQPSPLPLRRLRICQGREQRTARQRAESPPRRSVRQARHGEPDQTESAAWPGRCCPESAAEGTRDYVIVLEAGLAALTNRAMKDKPEA